MILSERIFQREKAAAKPLNDTIFQSSIVESGAHDGPTEAVHEKICTTSSWFIT